MSRIEDGGAVEAGRDIWEVSNQLAGYVDERTPQDLCDFLIRESKAAADLAAEITRLRAESAGMREVLEELIRTANAVAGADPNDDRSDDAFDMFIASKRRARAALSNSSQAEGQTP